MSKLYRYQCNDCQKPYYYLKAVVKQLSRVMQEYIKCIDKQSFGFNPDGTDEKG